MADDIEDVRNAEEQRARKRIDLDAIEERRQIRRDLRDIWQYGDIEDLKQAMLAYGIEEGSKNWDQTLAVWRDEIGRNRR